MEFIKQLRQTQKQRHAMLLSLCLPTRGDGRIFRITRMHFFREGLK